MNKKSFQHIALIGRPGKGVSDTVSAVANYLLQRSLTVTVESETAAGLSDCDLPIFFQDRLPHDLDLMIVVGGDGSLLNAAHLALPLNLPVLGINRGRLGFLTDIHPKEFDRIGHVLDGHYYLEKRFLLSTKHLFENQRAHTDIALNDVVLLPGDIAQMIEFDIIIDGNFVCHQRADGLIIATPTGSTAYALSGGGPILHPQLNAVVLVPMFPHTLSSRPIVISGDAKIELHISKRNEAAPDISCDGQRRIKIQPGSQLHIEKHPQLLQLIHPKDYEYFATLREKLGWQAQTGLKE